MNDDSDLRPLTRAEAEHAIKACERWHSDTLEDYFDELDNP